MIESVGWRAGDKKAVPIYVRDSESGALVLDEDNEPILDSDFAAVTSEFLRSAAADCFDWILKEREAPTGPQSNSIAIEEVVGLPDLSLDPKRYCQKFLSLCDAIKAAPNFSLGSVLELVPVSKFRKRSSDIYRYVEIQNIGQGDFDFEELRGWQLPQRAALQADPGDFFIAHIWGCAGKWFLTPQDAGNLIVTNGCARFRLKKGQEHRLVDLIAGLCSEAFRVQMRALTTGSDGLAEISDSDLLAIRLPIIKDTSQRQQLQQYVDTVLQTDVRFAKAISQVIRTIRNWPIPPARKSHCALV